MRTCFAESKDDVIHQLRARVAELEAQLVERDRKPVSEPVEPKLDEARSKVFDAIGSERIYQELKWGTLEEHPQSVGAYLTLMRVHLADAEAAWAKSNSDTVALDRLRRVLAIGVACGEQHGMPKRDYSAVNYGDG